MTLENTDVATFHGAADKPARPLWRSIGRGFLCRCPNCGEGKLFQGYLKSVDHCAVCQEEYFHHRADDLPPYLTVFIVGHIVVGLYMAMEEITPASLLVQLAIWLPVTLVMSLALLRPFKGATIGLQWAMRMHGFGGLSDAADH
ncbi:DUF983 domain-containing protein [Aureimonas glaciei]|uniref:DUF983 domain-containing protein n=1 Tax=Aureimonas glaciei TaxID=1776957 RepID=A0A916Y0W3_9HYPH|nr:DUF983 domain-containing protein [Aureimonas glaciei]GGD25676.1 hypothetical protein GCM10011335_30780 [Aureimonas glaciei]